MRIKKPEGNAGTFLYRIFQKSKLGKIYGKETENMLMVLFPLADTEKKKEEYIGKKLVISSMILCIGLLYGLLSMVMGNGNFLLEGNKIKREDYGGDDKTGYVYALTEEGETEELEVTVSARKYSKQQIRSIFEEVKNALPKAILGENKSLTEVKTNLNLLTQFPNQPVEIEWETTPYELMDTEGNIQKEEISAQGEELTLKAVLKYEDYEEELELKALVKPAIKEQMFKDTLQKEIERKNQENIQQLYLELPQSADGKKIVWREKKNIQGIWIILFAALAGIVTFTGKDRELRKEIEKQKRQMMLDYPEIIHKLSLLLGAGMSVVHAWEKITKDYTNKKRTEKNYYRHAYELMLFTLREIQNGMPEQEAYVLFGERCNLWKYKKLSALLIQNRRKGAKGMAELLFAEAEDAFEERKNEARKTGEEAGTKLLFPMFLMLVVVLVIIMVPAFMSFQ